MDDKQFVDSLKSTHGGAKANPKFSYEKTAAKDSSSKDLDFQFLLRHYAGDVKYTARDWLTRNKDPLERDHRSQRVDLDDGGIAGRSFQMPK